MRLRTLTRILEAPSLGASALEVCGCAETGRRCVGVRFAGDE